jgi:hypothetical protein
MMRSVRRTIVVTSLLLFVMTLAMWVRSCDRSDSLNRYRRDVAGADTYHDTTGIFIMRGMIGGGYLRIYPPTTQDWPPDARWRFHTAGANPIPWPHRFSMLGFRYWNTKLPGTPSFRGMDVVGGTIPLWFVATLLAIAPGVAARRLRHERRRRRRIAAGLCGACGYDVRASGERCPECGLLVPSPAGRGLG